MWSIRNTALEQPIPDDLPRNHGVLAVPCLYHRPAVELFAFEYNSTPQHIRTCGAVAAHFLEIAEQSGITLNGQTEPLTAVTDELLLSTTERVVGICGILSNTLSGVLSLQEFHQTGLELTIVLDGRKLVATWPGHQEESFELNALITRIAVEREKFSETEASKIAGLIIGELIDRNVALPGFTTKSAEGNQIVLQHHVMVQPDLDRVNYSEGLADLVTYLITQPQTKVDEKKKSEDPQLKAGVSERTEPGFLYRITSSIPIISYFFTESK